MKHWCAIKIEILNTVFSSGSICFALCIVSCSLIERPAKVILTE